MRTLIWKLHLMTRTSHSRSSYLMSEGRVNLRVRLQVLVYCEKWGFHHRSICIMTFGGPQFMILWPKIVG